MLSTVANSESGIKTAVSHRLYVDFREFFREVSRMDCQTPGIIMDQL